MLSTIIIADDLTGANASGVLLLDVGMKITTSLVNDIDSHWLEKYADSDGIAIPTNSRADQTEIAYEKVNKLGKLFKSQTSCTFNKRIDSTLRGNVGTEINALLDAFDEKRIAFVVPSYPASKRVCVGGFMLVDGVLLQNTSVAKDPKTPVSQSRVKGIIEEQTDRKVGEVLIDVIEKGKDAILESVNTLIDEGVEIVVFDALTDEQIDRIAEAVHDYKTPYITVGPGPFVKSISKCKRNLLNKEMHKKILMVIGSVTELTRTQIRYLMVKENVLYQHLDALMLLEKCEDDTYLTQVAQGIIEHTNGYEMVCVTTTDIYEDYLINLKEEADKRGIDIEAASARINLSLAKITKHIIVADQRFTGLFSSGGDTTVAITDIFGGSALEISGEILPLAVYGVLYNDAGKVINIATKGGLIGDKDGLYKCVNHLRKRINKKGSE